jgi:hypothetical protein
VSASPYQQVHFGPDGDAAIYQGGKLLAYGELVQMYEMLLSRLHVRLVDSDAFLRGGLGRENLAQTIEQIAAYEAEQRVPLATAGEESVEVEPQGWSSHIDWE